jgi:16S rRNA (guanine966-N2)-methyltransferase
MLASQGVLADSVVLDLFAGSGSFGIEALSRGAASATFVERDRVAARILTANVEQLGFADRATVVVAPVATVVSELGPADVVFCDPPYADDPWMDLLDAIDATVLVGHAEAPINLTERWEEVRRRTYGRSHILIARQRFRPHPRPF